MKLGLSIFIICTTFIFACQNNKAGDVNTILLDSLYKEGRNQIDFGHFDSANVLFQRLYKLAANDSFKAKAFNGFGIIENKKLHYKTAINHYNKAIKYALNSKNKDLEALLNVNKAAVYDNLGQYDSAIIFLNKGRLYFEEINPKSDKLIVPYNLLGIIHDRLKNHTKALKYYNQSLDLRLLYKKYKHIDASYNNIGNVYFNLRNFDSANYYYKLSRKFCKLNTRNLSVAYLNLAKGSIYQNFHDNGHYLDSCIALETEIKNEYGLFSALILKMDFATLSKNFILSKQVVEEIKSKNTIANYLDLNLIFHKNLVELYTKTKETNLVNIETLKVKILSDSMYALDKIGTTIGSELNFSDQKINTLSTRLETNKNVNKTKNIWLVAILFLLAIAVFFIYKYIKKSKAEKINKLYAQSANIGKLQPQHVMAGLLTNIAAMIDNGDLDAAKDKAIDMNMFLRKVIHSHNENYTLANEIENIKELLQVESKQRHFTYQINITKAVDALMSQRLPNLIFYIPIYNSIEYAIGHSQNGNIEVDIDWAKKRLILKVKDTGKKPLKVNKNIEELRGIGTIKMNEFLAIQKELTGREGKFEITEIVENNTKIGNVSVLEIPLNL